MKKVNLAMESRGCESLVEMEQFGTEELEFLPPG